MAAPAKVFSTPKSTGDQLQANEINAIDDAQYNRISRSGDSALLDDSAIEMGAYDLSVLNTGAGVGRFRPDADYTEFGGTGYPSFSSARTVSTVTCPVECVLNQTEFTSNGQRWQQVQASKTLNYWLWLPTGAVIKSVTVYVKKASGTAGLPGVLPSFNFGYCDMAADSFTSVATKTDAPADLAAYRLYHAMTSATVTHTVAVNRNYLITFTGDDDSTNISTGLFVYRPMVNVEISSLRAV